VKFLQRDREREENNFKENGADHETFRWCVSSIWMQPEIRLDWDGKRLEIVNPAVAAAGP
jgi:hypothetical protein